MQPPVHRAGADPPAVRSDCQIGDGVVVDSLASRSTHTSGPQSRRGEMRPDLAKSALPVDPYHGVDRGPPENSLVR
jgi:hypothetical protein